MKKALMFVGLFLFSVVFLSLIVSGKEITCNFIDSSSDNNKCILVEGPPNNLNEIKIWELYNWTYFAKKERPNAYQEVSGGRICVGDCSDIECNGGTSCLLNVEDISEERYYVKGICGESRGSTGIRGHGINEIVLGRNNEAFFFCGDYSNIDKFSESVKSQGLNLVSECIDTDKEDIYTYAPGGAGTHFELYNGNLKTGYLIPEFVYGYIQTVVVDRCGSLFWEDENDLYESICNEKTGLPEEKKIKCSGDTPYCTQGFCNSKNVPRCSDSDSINPYRKGEMESQDIGSEIEVSSDFCVLSEETNGITNLNEIDSCSGDKCFLVEQGCFGDYPIPDILEFKCPSGCSEGVCIGDTYSCDAGTCDKYTWLERISDWFKALFS